MNKEIMLGVLTGVFSGAILLALGSFFRQVILPWYQSFVYKGIRLGGTWSSRPDEYHVGDYVLHCRQHGHLVKGTITRTGPVGEKQTQQTDVFNLKG